MMAKIINERMAAQIEGDFVVFLIGMRINKFWKITKWLPPFLAMPRMIKELEKLHLRTQGFLVTTALVSQLFNIGAALIIWKPMRALKRTSIFRRGLRLTNG